MKIFRLLSVEKYIRSQQKENSGSSTADSLPKHPVGLRALGGADGGICAQLARSTAARIGGINAGREIIQTWSKGFLSPLSPAVLDPGGWMGNAHYFLLGIPSIGTNICAEN